jgi:CheY-like chemotaxis protein
LERVILLVEDNPDDEALILRAFAKSRIANKIELAHDGAEALDYLFSTGFHVGRDTTIQPQMVLLDLHLPKVSGIDVLRKIRADQRTKLLPVTVMTSSKDDDDLIKGCGLDVNSCLRKPIKLPQLFEAAGRLNLSWLLLNEHGRDHELFEASADQCPKK